MSHVKGRICVFTGSSPGARSEYADAARKLGRLLVERGYGLVYGGGNVGLMAVAADAVLEQRSEVVGVIPELLVDKELAHRGVSELRKRIEQDPAMRRYTDVAITTVEDVDEDNLRMYQSTESARSAFAKAKAKAESARARPSQPVTA